jgi:hypothetical protein
MFRVARVTVFEAGTPWNWVTNDAREAGEARLAQFLLVQYMQIIR